MLNNVERRIEEIEYKTLLKFNEIFSNCLPDFGTRLDDSLKYLDHITLPIIMASIEEKSYNPFSGIIERYVEYIVSQKMETHGFKFLPLGYSSDLCFETNHSVIHIDIKTANIGNPSDFKDTIPLGFNQTSYKGILPLGQRSGKFYVAKGKEPFRVYPNLPVEYVIDDGKKKITITNALLFIYPEYKNILDDIRKDYENVLSLIDDKLKNCILKILIEEQTKGVTNKSVAKFLAKKNKNTNIRTSRILSENVVRAYYIHNLADAIESKFDLNEKDTEKLKIFIERIKNVSESLRKKNIRPIVIISISIPNGKLAPLYDENIVSGKNYGKSIRYHYQNGFFKLLSNEEEKMSRVVFLSYNPEYEEILKGYFSNIYIFETRQKKV